MAGCTSSIHAKHHCNHRNSIHHSVTLEKEDTMKNEKKKVLVIEDSRMVREAVRMALEVHGFQVITANDGEEGLAVAAVEHPDDIVMDWNMPGLTGKALMHKLHANEHTSRIPIIVMSASSKAELHGSSEMVDIKGYFKKDSNVLERLVHALHQQVP